MRNRDGQWDTRTKSKSRVLVRARDTFIEILPLSALYFLSPPNPSLPDRSWCSFCFI